MFAEISLPISSFQTFTYLVPRALQNNLSVGSRVKVPFGKRKVNGIIVSLVEKSSFNGDLKSIIGTEDTIPELPNGLWKLINWISHYYITPIALAYNTVLPFTILADYTSRQTWFVKYIFNNDINNKEKIKQLSPKQHLIFSRIKKARPKYIKVSTFNTISSSPIQICKALEKKGFVYLTKRSQGQIGGTTSFKSIKKNISYNKEQLKVIKSLSDSIKSKKYSSSLSSRIL